MVRKMGRGRAREAKESAGINSVAQLHTISEINIHIGGYKFPVKFHFVSSQKERETNISSIFIFDIFYFKTAKRRTNIAFRVTSHKIMIADYPKRMSRTYRVHFGHCKLCAQIQHNFGIQLSVEEEEEENGVEQFSVCFLLLFG